MVIVTEIIMTRGRESLEKNQQPNFEHTNFKMYQRDELNIWDSSAEKMSVLEVIWESSVYRWRRCLKINEVN